MNKEFIYEGKAKKVYRTDNPQEYLIEYKDDATAFDGQKKGSIAGKGSINNQMSNLLFELLEKNNIPTHLIRECSHRETLVRKVTIIPLEVIVRNVAAGSFSKRYGIEEGRSLLNSTVEYCLKDDALHDPLINDSHIFALGILSSEDLATVQRLAFSINQILIGFFAKASLKLVDFKLEFGWTDAESDIGRQIVLADEISPDTCRLWDMKTGDKLDKDRFRRDLGQVKEAYEEVFHRITALTN